MEIMKEIEVPLDADSVLSPEIRYGSFDGYRGDNACLVFPLENEEDYKNHVGRVTFEEIDAIRCCRGEYSPYDSELSLHVEELLRCGTAIRIELPAKRHWVYEVENSSWLQQRHEYEYSHYQTSLLEEYVHYHFSFHDEFVDVIAKGIWLERLKYEQISMRTPDHPLMNLPDNLPAEDFVIEGIHCSVRDNPLSLQEIAERSKLCSQKLFQYWLTLDGETKPSYAAELRTVRGKSMMRFRGDLFQTDLPSADGISQEADVRKAFERWVAEVAERRRQMGK